MDAWKVFTFKIYNSLKTRSHNVHQGLSQKSHPKILASQREKFTQKPLSKNSWITQWDSRSSCQVISPETVDPKCHQSQCQSLFVISRYSYNRKPHTGPGKTFSEVQQSVQCQCLSTCWAAEAYELLVVGGADQDSELGTTCSPQVRDKESLSGYVCVGDSVAFEQGRAPRCALCVGRGQATIRIRHVCPLIMLWDSGGQRPLKQAQHGTTCRQLQPLLTPVCVQWAKLVSFPNFFFRLGHTASHIFHFKWHPHSLEGARFKPLKTFC